LAVVIENRMRHFIKDGVLTFIDGRNFVCHGLHIDKRDDGVKVEDIKKVSSQMVH